MSWEPSESGVRLVDLPPANPKPLNGSQFSQGTLWDPKAIKPSPEHRWPGGFTPERRNVIASRGEMYKMRPLSTETATIQVDPRYGRQDTEHTLLHEMGHHADYESDRIDFVNRYRLGSTNPIGPPGLEGAAEGYAAKHTVHRRNAPAEYKDTASYPRLRRNATFQEHFERVSGKSLIAAMGGDLRDGPAATAERLSKIMAKGGLQGRLFHGAGERFATTSRTDHDDSKLRELDTISVRHRDRA
jgi:hypothetical protein